MRLLMTVLLLLGSSLAHAERTRGTVFEGAFQLGVASVSWDGQYVADSGGTSDSASYAMGGVGIGLGGHVDGRTVLLGYARLSKAAEGERYSFASALYRGALAVVVRRQVASAVRVSGGAGVAVQGFLKAENTRGDLGLAPMAIGRLETTLGPLTAGLEISSAPYSSSGVGMHDAMVTFGFQSD